MDMLYSIGFSLWCVPLSVFFAGMTRFPPFFFSLSHPFRALDLIRASNNPFCLHSYLVYTIPWLEQGVYGAAVL